MVKTSALDGKGIPELVEAVNKHREFAVSSGQFAAKRAQQLKAEVSETVEHYLREMLWSKVATSGEMSKLLEEAPNRTLDPYTIARKILAEFN